MSRDELELEKLQAERDKLKQEVKEIQLRNDDRPNDRLVEKWKLAPGYLGVIASLTVVTVQSCNYLDQRESEQQFKFDAQIIGLVNDLSVGENDRVKRAAALQLAYLGESAIPLLIESIDFEPPEAVLESICQALVFVARDIEDVDIVVNPLLESTEDVVRRELAKRTPLTPNIRRHVTALNSVGGRLLVGTQEDDYFRQRSTIKKSLLEIEKSVASRLDPSEDKDDVLTRISAGTARLSELDEWGRQLRTESPIR